MASGRSSKRAFAAYIDGRDDDSDKVYRFQILLPNGTSTRLILHDPGEEMVMGEFAYAIRKELAKNSKIMYGSGRQILWNDNIYLEDMFDRKIKKKICFNLFKASKWHILRLCDGAGDSADTFKNMWDLTPDTDLLQELPAEYTFETALADLIDNSLQAVWYNSPEERRFLSVRVDEEKIVIFDTGPGMDDSDENSISKWGKMGSSNNRLTRPIAIGGKPPYLMPFFGMFGYGGPIASMHLGRRALVSSKTKVSRKVYTLQLVREALLDKSTSKSIWMTDGGIRDPSEYETRISPHGSFTQVEIHGLKLRCLESFKLQCLLKDIYFPYIQCDENLTSKTKMPIQFQVNDVDLAEVEGGEVAVTNLHSCNGPNFILELHFVLNQDNGTSGSPGLKSFRKAHARLKCVYFPIVEGKENIERILQKLEADGCGISENLDNFCRVSIRRLGRLLPDARWGILPFMEPKQRKGDKAQLLKRCCQRVKCFIDTDAGFSPTPSKTNLAHHDPFTIALRRFGIKLLGKASESMEPLVEIIKEGKPLSMQQVEKEYQEWILQMHDGYDEESECGEDEPVLVVCPHNKKRLGISADVVRVHRVIRRKGFSWKSGQKVKIVKGAPGCTKNNIYATLEFILLEGLQGDVCGEARLICRPLGCSENKGCSLSVNNGTAKLEIHESLSFPISIIDSGKFQAIDLALWNYQLEKKKEKAPATIDVLTGKLCSQLEIHGELPIKVPVSAGYDAPNEIVAVIRPANYSSSSSSKSLDQKYIIKDDLEMTIEVKLVPENKDYGKGEFLFAERKRPTSHNGLHGLYIFTLREQCPKLFRKAGVYTFSFSVICRDSSCKRQEMRVTVKPSSIVQKWRVECNEQDPLTKWPLIFRVGSCLPYLSLACYDVYSNRMPFSHPVEVKVRIIAKEHTLAQVDKVKMELSSDQHSLQITDILIECGQLDSIRPNYDATLEVCSADGVYSAQVPCKVMPGPFSFVKVVCSAELEKLLAPGFVIEVLKFEMLDMFGNHIEGGGEVLVDVDGLCFLDQIGSVRMVADQGYVDLSGLLKVVGGYGSKVCLNVFLGDELILKKEYQVAKRVLRVVSEVPKYCAAGTQLENIVFEVLDPDDLVDHSVHGQDHTLSIASESVKMDDAVQYGFRNGRCIVPFIPVPKEQGPFCILASHSRYPGLCMTIEVYVTNAPKMELVPVEQPSGTFGSSLPEHNISFVQDLSQCSNNHLSLLVKSIEDDARNHEEGVAEVGLRVRYHEDNLRLLNDQRKEIYNQICDLSALVDTQHLRQMNSLVYAKEHIERQIAESGNTAAAFFCNFSKAAQIQEPRFHFMQDIVGSVSLLGTVRNYNLSRILAEYLGENYMLAIVCKSYETASTLEMYDEYGNINRNSALHEVAARVGITISRRFLVICLDKLRAYKGGLLKGDPQRKLALPNPILPSKKIPGGFMGYAVNMINIDTHHLNPKTAAGHGLRETLFYRLFGELQVYETRADMMKAISCIDNGAVSLDGGIMRDKAIISFGDCEPKVRFPVCSQMELLPHEMETLELIVKKKGMWKALEEQIQKETEEHSKALVKFRKRTERFHKFLEEKKSLTNLLEYKPLQKTT